MARNPWFELVIVIIGRGREAVDGVVVTRYGTNAPEVINAIKQKVAEITLGPPRDVRIVPFYDRSTLIYTHENGTEVPQNKT